MALVLAGSLAVFTLLAYGFTVKGLSRETDQGLLRETRAFSAAIASAPSDQGLVEVTRGYLRERSSADVGLNSILIASFTGGYVLSNSTVKLESAIASLTTESTTAGAVSTVTYEGVSYRVATEPILSIDGTRLGVFVAALRTDTNSAVAGEIARVLSGAGLLVFGLGLAVSLAVSRASLKPLRNMATSAADITHRTRRSVIAYDGPNDELGSLATSLNDMLARLSDGAEEQRRFVADASHELRTPLAVIRGSAEVSLGDGATDSDRIEALHQIVAETGRLDRLVNDLLALARLDETESSAPQPLHVATLAEEAVARVRTQYPNVVATWAADDSLWIEADPDYVERALINLARNAARAAGAAGSIAISAVPFGDQVHIRVDDSGAGIAPDDIARVFERFFRGNGERSTDNQGGAGLGLAITKRLLELQGGRIWADNLSPQGARFTIELPAIAAPATEATP